MNNLNTWDVKQLIDLVGKSLNSILMSKPDISDEDLQKKAKALLKIYQGVFSELKNPSTNETLDFPVDETE